MKKYRLSLRFPGSSFGPIKDTRMALKGFGSKANYTFAGEGESYPGNRPKLLDHKLKVCMDYNLPGYLLLKLNRLY